MVSALLTMAMFSAAACDELQSLTGQGFALVRAGRCWSQGESFTEVAGGDGNVHPVEPFQIRRLVVGEHIRLFSVLRSDVTLPVVPGRLALMGYFGDGHSP